jgi:uncharacterized cofD-like protein
MKHVTTIGGGTGTFAVLSSLKNFPGISLSAIVTTADDGGSTGNLRDAYGFLPAGDARQALVALAEDGNVLRDLFAYRFTKSGVAGHSLGNLFLTALTDILGSDTKALEEASRILRVSGKVIPATDTPSTLVATLTDGTIVTYEHKIDERVLGRSSIASLAFAHATPLSFSARRAIETADVIILGPGDLYTSTIAALLPGGTRETMKNSKARLIYIANLFTKLGQTEGYSLQKHISEFERYTGRSPDSVLVHSGEFSPEVLARYAQEGEYPLMDDMGTDKRVRRTPLASVSVVPPLPNDPVARSLVRHDPVLVAEALSSILL